MKISYLLSNFSKTGLCLSAILLLINVNISRAASAPGGVVTNDSTFVVALGGAVNADSYIDTNTGTHYIRIINDISLTAPVNITSGTYTIISDGVARTISRSVAFSEMFVVGSGVTLNLGEGLSTTLLYFDGRKNQNVYGGNNLFSNYGTINMYSDVNIQNFSGKYGGVFNSGTTSVFNLYGGNITSNASTSGYGGGITNFGGTINMYGGSVISNQTTSNGGGIYNNGILKMYNGSITYNSGSNGGGVYVADTAQFKMMGGTVTSNFGTVGNGIYVRSSKFSMSGYAVVYDNVIYLLNGKSIVLDAALNTPNVNVIVPENYGVCVPLVKGSLTYPSLTVGDVANFTLQDNVNNYFLYLTEDKTTITLFDQPVSYVETACDTFYWAPADSTFTESTEFMVYYHRDGECDSLVHLDLTIHDSYIDTVYLAICENQLPYLYRDTLLAGFGTYQLNYLSVNQCDSVEILVLSGNPVYADTVNIAICENELPYLYNDTLLASAGQYTLDYQSIHLCDSIITLNLTVNPLYHHYDSLALCESLFPFSYGDSNISMVGDFDIRFTSVNGCDSLISLNVISYSEYLHTDSVTICEGDLPYHYGDSILEQAGDYNIVFSSVNHCDSIVALHLAVNPWNIPVITGETDICTGDSTFLAATAGIDVSYLWNTGDTTATTRVDSSGLYFVVTTNSFGCTASASREVIVSDIPQSTISGNTEICSSDSAHFAISGAAYYLWSTGDTTETIAVNSAGIYHVTAYNSNNCYSSDTVTLIVKSIPELEITPSQSICPGKTAHLVVSDTLDVLTTFIWSNSQVDSSIEVSPSVETNYIVTATNSNQCTATASSTVSIYAAPVISISGLSSICQSETDTLIASGGVSYLWSTGATTNSIPVTIQNSYSVTAHDINGCSATASKSVIVNPLPTPVISGITTICQGNSTTLTVNGGASYLWSNGQTNASISLNTQGNYTVTATSNHGCTATASQNVTVNPLPVASITGDTVICLGETAVLTASGGINYSWSSGDMGAIATLSPSQSTAYTVVVTNSEGCTASRLVHVVVNSLPSASIFGENSICQGQSAILTARGGTSYHWSTGSLDSTLTVDAPNTYSVTAYNANGCSATASRNIVVNPLPSPVISGVTSICQGQSTLLTAGGGSSYIWNNGQTNATISVNNSGTYTVTASNSHGCTASASQNIMVNQYPTVSISGDTVLCLGETAIVTASGGSSYSWSSGQNGAIATFTPAQTSYYTVNVTNDAGCSKTRLVTIKVNSLPSAAISGDNSICQGETTQLTASGGNSYIWSTGTTESQISVTTGAHYTVTVSNSDGCNASASVTVSVNPLPSAVISGTTSFCQGSSTSLTASGGATYQWSTGATTPSILISSAATYVVTTTSAAGCTSTASVTTTVNSLPAVSITGNRNFCLNSNTVLTATGGTSYHWSDGSTLNTLTVTSPGTYSVTATNSNNCSASGSAVISTYSLPNPNITGNTSICQGRSTTLTASGGSTYHWSTGVTSSYITVNATGNYTVTVTNSNGCTAETSATVIVNPLPQIIISGDNNICRGESTTLVASGGVSYLWTTGQTAQYIVVNPTVNTTYTVIVTDENNCSANSNITVTVNQLPVATISGNSAICVGDTVPLTASGGIHFLWNTGDTSNIINVSNPLTYTVTVTSAHGCTSTSSITTTSAALPIVNISGDNTVCQGENATLTATGGINYLWSTGATSSSISPNVAGNYSVTVSDALGCSSTASQNVVVNSLPTVNIYGNLTICQGQSTSLTAVGSPNITYEWNNGVTQSTINANTAGIYTVTVTNTNNCASTATATLTVNANPNPTISGTLSLCPGGSTTLTANGGSSYLWSNGSTTAANSVSPTSNSQYSVTVTNAANCTATTSASVVINPLPSISVSGATSFCEEQSTNLTATGGSSFHWSTGQSNATINVNTAGLYSVTTSNSFGCNTSTSVNITVNPLPVVSIYGDQTLCSGEVTTLTAGGGNSYSWSNGAATSSIVISPASSSSYVVTVTNSANCSATSSVLVTVNPLPSVAIHGNTSICEGSFATLSAIGGDHYLWNVGDTTSQINPTIPGEYSVTATNGYGCATSTSVTITINNLPIPVLSGNTIICEGESTVLLASGGIGYLWSNGEINDSITVSDAGDYSVTVTNDVGCTASASTSVSLLTTPSPLITGELTICEGESTTLTASGGIHYLWNNDESSDIISVNPDVSTTYYVTVSNSLGCTASASATITVNSTYSVTISDEICQGNNYTENGFNLPVQDTAGLFTYYLYLSSQSGCDSTISLNLTVNPLPDMSGHTISGSAFIFEEGPYMYTISAVPNAELYQWTITNPNWTLAQSTINNVQLTIPTAGMGTLSVIAINDCGLSSPAELLIQSTISVLEIDKFANIEIFPNPATQYVTVRNNDPLLAMTSIRIFDVNGKLVKIIKVEDGNETQIELQDFSNGIYFLKVFSADKLITTSKIVKN